MKLIDSDGSGRYRIYAVEYNQINGEMDDLRGKRSVVTQAETVRRETIEKVQKIAKLLRVLKSIGKLTKAYSGD